MGRGYIDREAYLLVSLSFIYFLKYWFITFKILHKTDGNSTLASVFISRREIGNYSVPFRIIVDHLTLLFPGNNEIIAYKQTFFSMKSVDVYNSSGHRKWRQKSIVC